MGLSPEISLPATDSKCFSSEAGRPSTQRPQLERQIFSVCLSDATRLTLGSLAFSLAWTPSTLLNRRDESGRPCLLPDLRGKGPVFHC